MILCSIFQDGSCRIVLGLSGNGEIITALPNEMDIVVPRKNDKIKIMAGLLRGATGKLIGVDGSDGIVKVDDTLDVKILDLILLAKLAQSWLTWGSKKDNVLYWSLLVVTKGFAGSAYCQNVCVSVCLSLSCLECVYTLGHGGRQVFQTGLNLNQFGFSILLVDGPNEEKFNINAIFFPQVINTFL